jgi:TaqI-like C-terminal specificity domain/Eco57I restriction-modification methylase
LGSQFTYLLNATELMRKVGELSDVTAQEVAASRQAYKGAYDALAPFKRLLDIWISEYFAIKGAKHITQEYAGAIVDDNYSKANQQDKKAIETALTLAKDKRFFHWELEFPEVFFDETKRKESGGFDAVVGNPPYGSVLDTLGKLFVNANYHAVKTVLDLFALFMEKPTQIVRSGSEVGLIVPSGWLTSPQHEPLRDYLLKRFAFQFIVHLPYDVFPDAYIDTIVYIGKKQSNTTDDYIIAKVKTKRFGIRDDAEQAFVDGLDYQVVDTTIWAQDTSRRLLTETSAPKMLIQQKARASSVEGSKILHVDRGITPIIPVANGSYTNIAQAFCGDFERYTFSEVTTIVKYDNTLAEYTPPIYFQSTGIIIRRIISRQQRIIVALNNKGYVFNKSYLIALCLPQTGYSPYYILTIIASRLQSRLFIWSSEIAKRDDFPQLDIQTIRNMPIRHISFITQTNERTRLLEKAKNLYEYCLDKNDQICVLGFVDHHLSKEPEESDVVHDLLAFLAEEMIRLNKEKRALQQEFLNWLVTALNVLPDKEGRQGIDVLTNKAKLTDYLGDYQKNEPSLTTEELLDILRKNKNHLGVSLSDANLLDRIKKTYEQSLQRVLPLKERLARTDRLIDQVVYRLYGLTEEEIKVVEGSN